MELTITEQSAPPLGDVRELRTGDVLRLVPGYERRPDWVRYLAAAAHAMARGAQIRRGGDE